MKNEQKICEGQVVGATLTNGISEQRQTLVLKVVGVPKGIEIDKLLGKISIYKQTSVEHKENLKKKEDIFTVMRDSTMNFSREGNTVSLAFKNLKLPNIYKHPVKGDDTPVHGLINVKHIRPRDIGYPAIKDFVGSSKNKRKKVRKVTRKVGSVGITIACYYKESENKTYVGVACCGRGDNFSKYVGRELARRRSTEKGEYLVIDGIRTFDEVVGYVAFYSKNVTPFYKSFLNSYKRYKKYGREE
jgi:hypothetical protein